MTDVMTLGEHCAWLKISGWYQNNKRIAAHLVYRFDQGKMTGFINLGYPENANGVNSIICDGIKNGSIKWEVGRRNLIEYAFWQSETAGMFAHVKGASHTDFTLLEPLKRIELKDVDLPVDIFED